MDLTMENLERWKHTFVPPDEATLLEYEVEGGASCRRIVGEPRREGT